MCYESFIDFVEFFVIPQRNANPTHIRFDGKIAGGNRQVVGMFRHQGKTWKVHADSHYEPIVLAYEFIKTNKDEDPFLEKTTASGSGNCLELKSNIRQLSTKPRFKHLYIYEVAKHS